MGLFLFVPFALRIINLPFTTLLLFVWADFVTLGQKELSKISNV